MKILVVSLAGIGDTLIATPLIHQLRENFPHAAIDVFVLWPGSRDLLQGNPHLNRLYQKNLIRDGAVKSLPFLLSLRKRRYDISINTHPQSRIPYRVVAHIIGARQRLSHRYENYGWWDRLLMTDTLEQDYSVHGIENNLRLLGLIGKSPSLASPEFEIFLSTAEEAWALEFLRANRLLERPTLGIHVGSGGTKNLRLKRWPFDHYRQLIGKLTDFHPELAIFLFGGPEEQAEHQQIAGELSDRSIFLPETKDLRQAAALIKQCRGFLSVDTALMHLAAAVKVPNQIVIEAPTLNATNPPYHQPYVLVRNPIIDGRNLDYYRYDGGGIKGTTEELLRCMASISVEDVYAAVTSAMGLAKDRSPGFR